MGAGGGRRRPSAVTQAQNVAKNALRSSLSIFFETLRPPAKRRARCDQTQNHSHQSKPAGRRPRASGRQTRAVHQHGPWGDLALQLVRRGGGSKPLDCRLECARRLRSVLALAGVRRPLPHLHGAAPRSSSQTAAVRGSAQKRQRPLDGVRENSPRPGNGADAPRTEKHG